MLPEQNGSYKVCINSNPSSNSPLSLSFFGGLPSTLRLTPILEVGVISVDSVRLLGDLGLGAISIKKI